MRLAPRHGRRGDRPAFVEQSDPGHHFLGNQMKLQHALLSAAIATAGIAMAPVANAATQSRTAWMAAGPACQLSLPTTSTSVRGRATGFRNEGTTNAVVICQFDTPDGSLNGAAVYLTSTDGVAHTVSCTAVNGFNLAPSASQIAYSTKSMGTTDVSGLAAVFQWDASDFGGTAGDDMPNQGFFSVTCTLPPKTQVNLYGMSYDEDVGA
jgi:hypothetical protein